LNVVYVGPVAENPNPNPDGGKFTIAAYQLDRYRYNFRYIVTSHDNITYCHRCWFTAMQKCIVWL